jgi:hypothetical protein
MRTPRAIALPVVCVRCENPNGSCKDDFFWPHAFLGFASSLLPAPLQVATAAGFLAYEVARTKTPRRKIDAIGEYSAGYVAARAMR